MSLEDGIRALIDRIPLVKGSLATEEATKHALVLPFIQALGYDIFDPDEVTAELTADIGTKQGEKVDYAILADERPVILIECKKVGDPLTADERVSQLFRYFTATEARIGVLTNGIIYKFFSDIERRNMMDRDPFWEIDLEDLDDDDLEQINRLFGKAFDAAATLDSASRLKDVSMMTGVLTREFDDPSEDFARALVNIAYRGERRVTPTNSERFRQLAKLALDEFVSVKMRSNQHSSEVQVPNDEPKQKIVTTAQEIEGYHIVKSIVRTVVDSNRVSYRDRAKHCSILMDNSQRRPICLFRFNDEDRKQLVLFDNDQSQTLHSISSLDDIYAHADQLRQTARRYLES